MRFFRDWISTGSGVDRFIVTVSGRRGDCVEGT